MPLSAALTRLLHDTLNGQDQSRKNTLSLKHVGGGSINESYRINYGSRSYFVKLNSAVKFPQLFRKEKHGLERISSSHQFRTPAIIGLIESEGMQLLLLEWIEKGTPTPQFWKDFGRKLAALHEVTGDRFGLDEDNYMGSVPQKNEPHDDWCSFFMEARLKPMVLRCSQKGILQKKHFSRFESLENKLAGIFNAEPPCLLHGDLWSGNFICSADNEPVLIDPAVYYGHRSVDLGMSTLFGGFHSSFYEAYQYHTPLPSNYREQWAIANLYPLLIHLYLFGAGYLPQIEDILADFS